MGKLKAKKSKYWKNYNDVVRDVVSKGGSVEFHPIQGDIFGNGVPMMITVIRKGKEN